MTKIKSILDRLRIWGAEPFLSGGPYKPDPDDERAGFYVSRDGLRWEFKPFANGGTIKFLSAARPVAGEHACGFPIDAVRLTIVDDLEENRIELPIDWPPPTPRKDHHMSDDKKEPGAAISAYERGRAAYREGISAHECPHRGDEATAWLNGWKDEADRVPIALRSIPSMPKPFKRPADAPGFDEAIAILDMVAIGGEGEELRISFPKGAAFYEGFCAGVYGFDLDDNPQVLTALRKEWGAGCAGGQLMAAALRLGSGAVDTSEVDRLKAARASAVEHIRKLCAADGDNDWPDDLHLGDVVEKHLLRHIWAQQDQSPIAFDLLKRLCGMASVDYLKTIMSATKDPADAAAKLADQIADRAGSVIMPGLRRPLSMDYCRGALQFGERIAELYPEMQWLRGAAAEYIAGEGITRPGPQNFANVLTELCAAIGYDVDKLYSEMVIDPKAAAMTLYHKVADQDAAAREMLAEKTMKSPDTVGMKMNTIEGGRWYFRNGFGFPGGGAMDLTGWPVARQTSCSITIGQKVEVTDAAIGTDEPDAEDVRTIELTGCDDAADAVDRLAIDFGQSHPWRAVIDIREGSRGVAVFEYHVKDGQFVADEMQGISPEAITAGRCLKSICEVIGVDLDAVLTSFNEYGTAAAAAMIIRARVAVRPPSKVEELKSGELRLVRMKGFDDDNVIVIAPGEVMVLTWQPAASGLELIDFPAEGVAAIIDQLKSVSA